MWTAILAIYLLGAVMVMALAYINDRWAHTSISEIAILGGLWPLWLVMACMDGF